MKFSSIGSDCKIGKNVTLINCLIDHTVKIEEDCCITNAIIQNNVTIRAGTTVNSGTIITSGVVVKPKRTIPEGSLCSLYTYDAEEKQFVPFDADHTNDFFDEGGFSIVTRDMALKESERLGAPALKDEESDLSEGGEESDADPKEEFRAECSDLFGEILQEQGFKQKTQEEFMRTLIMEIRSSRLKFAVEPTDVVEVVFDQIIE